MAYATEVLISLMPGYRNAGPRGYTEMRFKIRVCIKEQVKQMIINWKSE